jgi:tetratricopeptide (TPR) repeat protein
VPNTTLLTSDDIEDLIDHDGGETELLDAAGKLVAAVDEGRLADPDDTAYALFRAAELTWAAGRHEDAFTLCERSIEADKADAVEQGPALTLRAVVLVELGRRDEGMAAFAELRPRLSAEPDAAEYLTAALVEIDQAELALEWLTEALVAGIDHVQSFASMDSDPQPERAVTILALAEERHELRHHLGLPHDDLDELAEQLSEAADQDAGIESDEPLVLFWPQAEFAQLALRAPALAADLGDWDTYRARTERSMSRAAEYSPERITMVPASIDAIAAFAAEQGHETIDSEIIEEYTNEVEPEPGAMTWPPERNAPCWCGSGLKYKKCCLPRSR